MRSKKQELTFNVAADLIDEPATSFIIREPRTFFDELSMTSLK